MTVDHNGHRVTFAANGRIFVDDKCISLAIRQTNGGHYTYIAHDRFAGASDGFDAKVGAGSTSAQDRAAFASRTCRVGSRRRSRSAARSTSTG